MRNAFDSGPRSDDGQEGTPSPACRQKSGCGCGCDLLLDILGLALEYAIILDIASSSSHHPNVLSIVSLFYLSSWPLLSLLWVVWAVIYDI